MFAVTKQQWTEAQEVECPLSAGSEGCGSTFYQVTRPFIVIIRLLGGFPYTIHEDVLHVKVCSRWGFYSLIIMIFQYSLLLLTTHHLYLKRDDPFDTKLFDIINIIILVYQACGPLTFLFEVPAIIRYFAKWHGYEKDLRLCNISLDRKLKKWALLLLVPAILYVFISTYFQVKIHGSLIHVPSLAVLNIHTASHLSFCMICGLFLYSTAGKIIRRIRKVAEDRDAAEVAACRRCWLTLAELTSDLGNALGPTLMEILLFASVVLISGCYFIMFFFRSFNDMDDHEKRTAITGRIFYNILTFSCITLLCEFGHRCTNAVGSNLLQELLRLNASPQEKDLHREVNMFIQSVWMRYPDMVLCGFLTLNRRLLVSLVSGGVTYLIVLVQFRSSDQHH